MAPRLKYVTLIGGWVLGVLLPPMVHATLIGDEVDFVLLNDAREERFRSTILVDDEVEIAFCLRAIDDACVIESSFDIRASSITSELTNRSDTAQILGASFIRIESLDWLDTSTEIIGFEYSELSYPVTPTNTLSGNLLDSFTPGFTIGAGETFSSVGVLITRPVPEPGPIGLVAAGILISARLGRRLMLGRGTTVS